MKTKRTQAEDIVWRAFRERRKEIRANAEAEAREIWAAAASKAPDCIQRHTEKERELRARNETCWTLQDLADLVERYIAHVPKTTKEARALVCAAQGFIVAVHWYTEERLKVCEFVEALWEEDVRREGRARRAAEAVAAAAGGEG